FFGDLGLHFLASAGRVLAAVAIALITAVPLGLILGQAPKLDRVFAPLIAILYPIPKIVFLPVIYVLLGITDISKVFLIALIIFFQILVVVRDEAANLHPELIISVKSLGAGRRALFRYVYFPAAMPAVLQHTGLVITSSWRLIRYCSILKCTAASWPWAYWAWFSIFPFLDLSLNLTVICIWRTAKT
ncbi:MAG: ABC transporter permease subunit, partial [Deltaproteobacteria bacterium]|nr:ABC transporter permease subunit [Deltaproteobacteria bacterium]